MVEPIIYHQNVIDTYLFLIKENIHLATKLLIENEQNIQPYDPLKKHILYQGKAKHLQIMTLIGITTEHLVKIILLKRGHIINISKVQTKFNEDFLINLKRANEKILTQEEINQLYENSIKNLNIEFSNKLLKFDECISLFKNSCKEDYFDSVKEYILNPHSDIYDGDEYFGYKKIKPEKILDVIQKMRNSYLHLAEARNEQLGIIWYLLNFLIWFSKKEYPDFFKGEEFVGSEVNKCLFENNKTKGKKD